MFSFHLKHFVYRELRRAPQKLSFCFKSPDTGTVRILGNILFQVYRGGRGGDCLFLRAREWRIDLQERKKIAVPLGCAWEAWLQVKLNHALFDIPKLVILSF